MIVQGSCFYDVRKDHSSAQQLVHAKSGTAGQAIALACMRAKYLGVPMDG